MGAVEREYFHVRAIYTPPGKLSNTAAATDYTETELRNQIVQPYRTGRDFLIGGSAVNRSMINEIYITSTSEPAAVILPIAKLAQQQDRTMSRLFSDGWLVAKSGTDVNRRFLSALEPEAVLQPDRTELVDHSNVFVVYGRNEALRQALFTFLRSIALRPMEWSELVAQTGSGTPYVGDVIAKGFEVAQAAVVLLTPDDEARLHSDFVREGEPAFETELMGQPRQNVLIEAGIALGVFPERTILVESGTLRPISDLQGRHTIRIANAIGRRQELADRLRTAGCAVNTAGTDWHSAGDFG